MQMRLKHYIAMNIKKKSMIDVISKKCIFNNCNTRPNYNIPTESKGLYCYKHKEANMINVTTPRCIYVNCNIYPTYNLPNKTKPLYCNEHKFDNMIDVVHHLCIHDGCKTRPSYNYPNETELLYCKKHKFKNMINIVNKNKKCIYNNCDTIPSYNFSNETKALYCNEHKLDNMINIMNIKCIYENCNIIPTFNFPTETKVLYCNEHKKDGMIAIKSKKCIYDGCNTRPSYNLQTEHIPLYCSKHKSDEMIDIINKNKICIHKDCNMRPYFNFSTETKGLYCSIHKKPTMINIRSKKCQHAKCKEAVLFGFKNKNPHYCFEHKQPNMINLILENKCSILECDNEYDHIIDENKYCLKHCPEKFKTNIKKLCKYCDIKEESNHVCKDCKKIQNKKEWAIVRYLRKAIDTEFTYNSSKMLQSCSKKRPDIYFELDKHCVIVEIDEHQHNTYDDSCECARLNEIVNGIGGKSVIIIRYNPDTVKHKDKPLTISQSDRIDLLVKTIKKELVKEYDTFIVKIIQLYYNDDYKEYKPIKKENITDLVCI